MRTYPLKHLNEIYYITSGWKSEGETEDECRLTLSGTKGRDTPYRSGVEDDHCSQSHSIGRIEMRGRERENERERDAKKSSDEGVNPFPYFMKPNL